MYSIAVVITTPVVNPIWVLKLNIGAIKNVSGIIIANLINSFKTINTFSLCGSLSFINKANMAITQEVDTIPTKVLTTVDLILFIETIFSSSLFINDILSSLSIKLKVLPKARSFDSPNSLNMSTPTSKFPIIPSLLVVALLNRPFPSPLNFITGERRFLLL